MPENDTDLIQIGEALARHGVRYVVVGGVAVFLNGGETPTLDVDLALEISDENIEKLADALEDLHAKPKRWVTDSFRLTRMDMAGSWLHLESPAGDIDLIIRPPSITFEVLDEDAIDLLIGPVTLRVASRKRLIEMKMAAGRPKDLIHVNELLAAERLENEGQAN